MKLQRINTYLSNNSENIQVIAISLPYKQFNKRFKSISSFWRTLSNGTHSIAGVSNRVYFNNIAGTYISVQENGIIQILIVYDERNKKLNQLQVGSRIKKLLSVSCEINYGSYTDFKLRIAEILDIKQNVQLFGGWYKNNMIG
ncbi:MAG: hypothetical protein WCG74_12510 [Sediminibacterium sp.]